MMKIGIVGTGMLGEAVGLHLLDVGYEITVFNRSKEKTEKLENKGALVVDLSLIHISEPTRRS